MQTVSGQSRSANQQLAEHRTPTRRPTYREFLLGAIFPVLITVVLSPIDDSAKYRPTSLLPESPDPMVKDHCLPNRNRGIIDQVRGLLT